MAAASLSTGLPSEAESFRDAVTRFCERRLGADVQDRRAVPFSRDLWGAMAELGLLEVGGTEMPDAMLLACVGVEQLGYFGFPGPVPHAVAASAVAGEVRAARASGERIVTVGAEPIVGWAALADDVFLLQDANVHLGAVCERVDTLGDTSAATVQRGRCTGQPVAPVMARYDMAMAAYVGGAGHFFVDLAADHARTRKQFGRALGEFQAVAFPIAEVLIALDAAQLITRAAAMAIDTGRPDAGTLAAAARLSASRAAQRAGFVAHQTLGAYGVLEDGPVAWLSRRIQDYATLAPSARSLRASLALTAAGTLNPELWPSDEAA